MWAIAFRIRSKRKPRLGPSSSAASRPAIVCRIDDDQHAAEVLGGGAHQRRAADVDFLDQRVERGRRIRGRLHERIQVDDDDVDQAESVGLERRQIVGAIAPRENAAVQRRMQRLDAAVHHLGKAGQLGDIGHREAGVGQGAGGAAGRHQLESTGGEALSEIGDRQSCQKHSAGLLA